eukprot:gb/GECG01014874.1/.p1 GENE.gb/GECG01014874.1/~~gb/GECG01014874.1/.p1  ORF type:complete len:663 (+),score=87.91 gb/GECG01014874.1/:1-1989(+)
MALSMSMDGTRESSTPNNGGYMTNAFGNGDINNYVKREKGTQNRRKGKPGRPRKENRRAPADSTESSKPEPVRRSKRARQKAETTYDTLASDAEAEELKIALELSKKQKKRPSYANMPYAPTYYPTKEEFSEPLKYIAKVKKEAEAFGICKIVPPEGWSPPCGLAADICSRKFPTRLQKLYKLQEGAPFPDGKNYTLPEYKEMAEAFKQQFPHLISSKENVDKAKQVLREREVPECEIEGMSDEHILALAVEREYWNIVESPKEVSVEYGNDQDTQDFGSGFLKRPEVEEYQAQSVGTKRDRYARNKAMEDVEYSVAGNEDRNAKCRNPLADGLTERVNIEFDNPEFYRRTGWNLNNLPHLEGSLLRYISDGVNGVNVPWLYLGMMFATFAWHVEDNFLYSINYLHFGSSKQWYGVPSSYADKFESVFKTNLYKQFKVYPDLLTYLTVVLPPAVLMQEDVPVYRAIQNEGEFILTFPRAYHSGFSHGFNVGEACNFALPDWIPWGRQAVESYHKAKTPRSSVFSHEKLLVELAKCCEDFSPGDCQYIARELKQIVYNESMLRQRLLEDGFDETARFYVKNDADKRMDCLRCKAPCYLSAVMCRTCGTDVMACVRHARSLCSCSPGGDGKILLYWHKIDDLQSLLARVEKRAFASVQQHAAYK